MIVKSLFVFLSIQFAYSAPSYSELTSEERARLKSVTPQHFEYFSDLFDRVNESVVSIATLQVENKNDRPVKKRSLGSGFLINDQGLVITNYHVVIKQKAIAVELSDKKVWKATLIGSDPYSDLALLKVDFGARKVKALPLGDSDKIRIGQMVLAIGNPFGFENTVSHGMISGRGRVISPLSSQKRFDDYLQMDVPINPGNSGGPLINMQGEAIGVNAAISSTGSGIAFAVPINVVKKNLAVLLAKGFVPRGWLGVIPEQGLDGKIRVIKVVKRSPAKKFGLRLGDVLHKWAGEPIDSLEELSDLIADTQPGQVVGIEIKRGLQTKVLRIRMGSMRKNPLGE